MKTTLVLTFFFYLIPFLNAELVWESTEIEKETPVGAKSISAEFKFKNTGKEKIKIVSLGSDCGCTMAELEKKEYEEGESGEIKVVFEIGDRVGRQEKRITVLTDDNKLNWPKILILKTTVPEVLTIEKRVLTWERGEAFAEKTLSLKPNKNLKDYRLTAVCDNELIKVTLSKPDSNGVYLLKILPQEEADSQRGNIRITISWGENEARDFIVFSKIQ